MIRLTNVNFDDFGSDYRVLAVSNAQEALAIFGRESIDLCILDVSGLDYESLLLCHHLGKLSLRQHLPIIVLTPRRSESSITGTAAYLTQPFRLAQLHRLVDKLLKNSSLRVCNSEQETVSDNSIIKCVPMYLK